MHTQQQEPLGNRYRFLRGINSTVLTFGFLYNMEDASPLVTIEKVESAVEQSWFVNVVSNADKLPQGYYDAIMVLAHMDVKDHLVTVILDKIRELVGPSMPVQFITGHTHYRGVQTMDEASISFEAGRFLDTLGFVSFPKQQTLQKVVRGLQQGGSGVPNNNNTPPLLGPGGTEWPNVSDSNTNNMTAATAAPTGSNASGTIPPTAAEAVDSWPNTWFNESPPPTSAPTPKTSELFRYLFMDTEVSKLEKILNVSELSTDDGSRLSEFILRTRKELGLLDLIGCTPESYYVNRTVQDEDSIWNVFLNQVAPYRLLKSTSSSGNTTRQKVFLGAMGAFRYDLLGRALVVDDVIAVAPFNETIISLGPNISGSVLKQLITQVLNTQPNDENPKWDNFAVSPNLNNILPEVPYDIMAPVRGVPAILDGLKKLNFTGRIEQTDSGFTITDVWLDFVKSRWQCEDKDEDDESSNVGSSSGNNGSNNHHSTGSPSSDGKEHPVHSGTPYTEVNKEKDRKRLVVACVGVGVVLFLGSLYIIQQHRSWLVRYRARQRLILLTDQEFHTDNELI